MEKPTPLGVGFYLHHLSLSLRASANTGVAISMPNTTNKPKSQEKSIDKNRQIRNGHCEHCRCVAIFAPTTKRAKCQEKSIDKNRQVRNGHCEHRRCVAISFLRGGFPRVLTHPRNDRFYAAAHSRSRQSLFVPEMGVKGGKTLIKSEKVGYGKFVYIIYEKPRKREPGKA